MLLAIYEITQSLIDHLINHILHFIKLSYRLRECTVRLTKLRIIFLTSLNTVFEWIKRS